MRPYSAPWWLPGGDLQSIIPASVRKPPRPRVPLTRDRWRTPDGDFVDVHFGGDPRAGRLLVLFHGLEGCSDSHYARSVLGHAEDNGWRVAIPHFRSCSAGPDQFCCNGEMNELPRFYHSGDSEEVDWMLRKFGTQVCAAGVSLGGNCLLKWLGERGDAAGEVVLRAAAVSVPFDIDTASRRLDRFLNRISYVHHFLTTLKRKALAKLERFPDLYSAAAVRAASSFHDFDDLVTAPLHGFDDAEDYWMRASSKPWLDRIRVPTLLLNARNDPFLPEHELDELKRKAPPSLLLEFPSTGGHAGFMTGPFPGHHTWLPERIFRFLEEQ